MKLRKTAISSTLRDVSIALHQSKIILHTSFIAIIILVAMACNQTSNQQHYYQIKGFSQGTSYTITYSLPIADTSKMNLQPAIDSVLNQFEESLSSYRPTSIISRVNRNEAVEVDDYFVRVFNRSVEVSKWTNGAFDISAAPLFSIWGWGPEKKIEVSQHLIDSLMLFVGMDKVRLDGRKVIKTIPELTLNVNAIAKGYSCDVIAAYLESCGSLNYLVEIGGEMCLKGVNSKGTVWKIGIDRPIDGNILPGEQLQTILQLSNISVATSGNYRRFFMEDGRKYGHSIDPKTGYSAKQDLLCVTVLAKDCITADALATAFMVMGVEKSKQLIATLPDVEAYFVYHDESGFDRVDYTEGIAKLVVQE